MNKEEVLKLAKLARIEVSGEEAESLSGEFGAILGYVGEIKKLDHTFAGTEALPPQAQGDFAVRNEMREDGEPHESGIYTKDILEQAPTREKNYIKVKKIL